MTLSVNVDELDILSVSVGQKAEITLDAIEDQQFEGEITGIDKSGTSNGGVTKYAVEITVSKDDSMLAGMNASASIIVSEAENVLLIPAQAVTEEGNTSYVYTEKDDSSGELSGKTEVETGATDGNQIEITSGLTEGTTVYYQAMGTSSSDSENSAMDFMQGNDMKGGFDSQGGGGNPGGGEAPSGGNGGAPSGGMGGGKQ
jgi:multidrug efflux pump subunit AcrA (membrane-fusion protein)